MTLLTYTTRDTLLYRPQSGYPRLQIDILRKIAALLQGQTFPQTFCIFYFDVKILFVREVIKRIGLFSTTINHLSPNLSNKITYETDQI